MNINKKILCSVVTILLLSACESEDKYKKEKCVNCMPDSSSVSSSSGSSNSSSSTSSSSSGSSSSSSSSSGSTSTSSSSGSSSSGSSNVTINFSKNNDKITWTKKDDEEQAMGLALSSQNALVYSKWDNRLIIINPSTQSISSDELYLDVTGERYSSGETVLVDADTGASEQILAKVLVNNAGTTAFSLLEKYDEDDSKDIGIGIYSDDISNGVPSARFAKRAATVANYFNYPEIKDIALSHDGQTVIAGGNDRKIKVFNANDLNNPSEIDTGRKIRSLSFSLDDKYIFSGSSGLSKHIKIFDATSKRELASIVTSDIPKAVVEIPDADKIIAIFAGSNKVKIYDISDINAPTLDKTLIINGSAKSISISPDKKTFAITATGKQVNLLSIDGGNTPKVITLDENANGAEFLSETKLMVTTGTEILYFDITLSN